MEQRCINNDELNTNNTGNIGNTSADTDKKKTWFQNQSAKKLEFDSKNNSYSNSEKDLKLEAKKKGFKIEKKPCLNIN